jgi:hypothetical protein
MSTLLLNPRQMYAPDPEQQPVAAGVLTVVVHVLFAAVLFLNMSWQQKIRPQASVKLWEAMPTTPAKAMPATPVKAERARKRQDTDHTSGAGGDFACCAPTTCATHRHSASANDRTAARRPSGTETRACRQTGA